jgi:hypothetical protein
MGHRQPATKLITDNSTADGILNGKIKQNRSKGIDMRYYWLRNCVKQGQFTVQWEPGKFNLANYFTKHHPPAHHIALQPVYLFDVNYIPDLQGCIKILGGCATGNLAATRTSPGTKSGINSSPIKNTCEIQSSMSGDIQSSMSGEIQRSMSGGIQRSMSGGTQRALVQSSLKLAMLMKELKAHTHTHTHTPVA